MGWEDALSRANSLFVDGSFEEALDAYDEAVDTRGSEDSQLLSKRSACHAKLLNFAEAISDIDRAIAIEPQNSKFLAQKGSVLFSKAEYSEAKNFYEQANTHDSANTYKIWIRKCAAEQKLAESGGSSSWATTTNIAELAAQAAEQEPQPQQPTATASTSTSSSAPAVTQSQNIKHEWYQNADYVIISIFCKNLAPEQIQHSFTSTHLSVSIRADPQKEDTWRWETDLCDSIVPDQSSLKIGKVKVEIFLKKNLACKWESLEKKDMDVPIRNWVDTSAMNKHAYPSSSKVKKDWSSLDKEAEKIVGEETPSGDAAVQKLFQDIYSKADEDTRRAMNKSYVESGGTVLSTNWKDVGARKVEGGAPPSRK